MKYSNEVQREQFSIVYNMLADILKMKHVEYDALNLFPFRKNRHVYARTDSNHGNGFCTIFYNDRCLWGISALENTAFGINKKIKSRDLVVSSPHSVCVK